MQARDGQYLLQSNIDSSGQRCWWAARSRARTRGSSTSMRRATSSRRSDDTPYFQLGESESTASPSSTACSPPATPQKEAAKCVLISFDSTIKSNISVGLPIDMLWYPRDSAARGRAAAHPRGGPVFLDAAARAGAGACGGYSGNCPIRIGWSDPSSRRALSTRDSIAPAQARRAAHPPFPARECRQYARPYP